MATISEIAKAAGVGVGTVSRYLNHRDTVSAAKQKQIQTAIEQLHYTPNAIASQLRAQSTNNIGVLVSRISNPFFAQLFDALERELHRYGFQVMVMQTHDDPEAERRFLDQLKQQQVDGVILASVENSDLLAQLAPTYAKQMVLLNEESLQVALPTVSLNHYQATWDALNYLYDQGHRRISYATGGNYPSTHHGRSRTQAYLDFCQAHGLIIDDQLIFAQQHTLTDGQQLGTKLSQLAPNLRPTAIFSNSDEVAVGLINQLQAQHFRVPDDIAVVGYDDQPFAKFAPVPLTTVRQPVLSMAQVAVDQLLHNLGKINTPALQPDLGLQLIIRKSA
ncbi:LacI family transcriptional regulator [Lactobacillus pentosus] [Lactiplantibacillus mudanjiangensis]|uniref:LacI family DNA-binding transcriptional regulator n=1 Tax=Lactiplantibacillus mudanjiangensis TaxID=1296538 RepID=UPI0010148F06|nr:LacI family transcriptional regulator [Lactobacillus pentosus] [Lactiplantibacillus mudanjiangensis]